MNELFRGKYRIPSVRLKHWDYSHPGYYFITICTKNRIPFFGTLNNGKMILNTFGEIIKKYWMEIPNHFSHVSIDEFIIMPEHIHGIIVIRERNNMIHNDDAINRRDAIHCRDAINRVSSNGGITNHNNPMLSNDSLGAIIRWLKGRTTFEIRKIHPHFSWQTRFCDRIVSDDEGLNNIREYIQYNPMKHSFRDKP